MSSATVHSPAAGQASRHPEPRATPAHASITRDHALAWSMAVLLVAGSIAFLAGGRVHPAIGASLGGGADAFFQAFADKVRHTHGWHAMHLLILAGPLCWAVAAPALLDARRAEARTLISAARSALLLSGALWAVAFVLDGFGAPVYADAIAASPGDAGILVSFRANAVMMSRLGLVSWIAGGLGMVGLALALPGARPRSAWTVAVTIAGIAIGLWPLLAAIEGEYAAGPFTSSWWRPNAIAVALWYVVLAASLLRGDRR